MLLNDVRRCLSANTLNYRKLKVDCRGSQRGIASPALLRAPEGTLPISAAPCPESKTRFNRTLPFCTKRHTQISGEAMLISAIRSHCNKSPGHFKAEISVMCSTALRSKILSRKSTIHVELAVQSKIDWNYLYDLMNVPKTGNSRNKESITRCSSHSVRQRIWNDMKPLERTGKLINYCCNRLAMLSARMKMASSPHINQLLRTITIYRKCLLRVTRRL